jgi:hypothetical protein
MHCCYACYENDNIALQNDNKMTQIMVQLTDSAYRWLAHSKTLDAYIVSYVSCCAVKCAKVYCLRGPE